MNQQEEAERVQELTARIDVPGLLATIQKLGAVLGGDLTHVKEAVQIVGSVQERVARLHAEQEAVERDIAAAKENLAAFQKQAEARKAELQVSIEALANASAEAKKKLAIIEHADEVLSGMRAAIR